MKKKTDELKKHNSFQRKPSTLNFRFRPVPEQTCYELGLNIDGVSMKYSFFRNKW